MPFPWSIIIGFVLLGVGIALILVGVLVEGASELTTYGSPVLGAGLGMLTGKGADVVQTAIKKAGEPE